MEKIYLKTDYTDCSYITAGKLYEAKVAQTVKDDGVNYDAYYITADNGMEIYAYIDGKIPHLNNDGHFYLHKQEPTYVRPIMTTEARDILDSIHETVGAETRSDSIVKFMEMHTEMEVELCAVKEKCIDIERITSRRSGPNSISKNIHKHDIEQAKHRAKVSSLNYEILIEKKKNKEWKVWTCVSMLTAIAALVALTIQS